MGLTMNSDIAFLEEDGTNFCLIAASTDGLVRLGKFISQRDQMLCSVPSDETMEPSVQPVPTPDLSNYLGVLGTDGCPLGTNIVHDETTCIDMAEEIGLFWKEGQMKEDLGNPNVVCHWCELCNPKQARLTSDHGRGAAYLCQGDSMPYRIGFGGATECLVGYNFGDTFDKITASADCRTAATSLG
eukprot:UN23676